MSFPRAAQITAELGDVRDRFPTEAQLAAEAGVAPVTRASGKSRGVVSRFACNKRMRAAITCFAIRILGRAWLHVLWRAWQNHQTYDTAQHEAAIHLAA